MDAFNIVLLIFTISILIAILSIPTLIAFKVSRTLIRSVKKTIDVIFN